MADEPDLKAATIVTVGMREPYPTGTPPNGLLIPGRVHTPQELTLGANWTSQSEANLAAGGLIKGGAAWEEPVIP